MTLAVRREILGNQELKTFRLQTRPIDVEGRTDGVVQVVWHPDNEARSVVLTLNNDELGPFMEAFSAASEFATFGERPEVVAPGPEPSGAPRGKPGVLEMTLEVRHALGNRVAASSAAVFNLQTPNKRVCLHERFNREVETLTTSVLNDLIRGGAYAD